MTPDQSDAFLIRSGVFAVLALFVVVDVVMVGFLLFHRLNQDLRDFRIFRIFSFLHLCASRPQDPSWMTTRCKHV